MKRLSTSIISLVLLVLACNIGGPVTSATRPTSPPEPQSVPPGAAQQPCGDGVCAAAEQAGPNLCPADCAVPEAAAPPTAKAAPATASEPAPTEAEAPPTSTLAPPQLTYVTTHQLPEGTHRPEILVTETGEVVVVVVQPAGEPGVGRVKHQAYRFDANWDQIGQPFVVTQITEEYGEPADHRAAIVNGELVVVYQSLNLGDDLPPQGATGPMEEYAKDQSLLLARFSLDGEELFRGPIVAHATDRSEDNFPDHCLLWLDDRLLVSSGGERQLKIREVDLNANILATHIFETSPATIPGEIGNSLLHDGRRLLFFSAGNPHQSAQLTVTELTDEFTVAGITEFYEEARRQNFPTGALLYGNFVFAGYISQERSGAANVESNPFDPYLKILDENLDVVTDVQVGEAGFAHVHPTLTRLGNRLFVAWSERVTDGGMAHPQVFVEEFELSDVP